MLDVLGQLPDELLSVSRAEWPFGRNLRAGIAQLDLWSELPKPLATGIEDTCREWQQLRRGQHRFFEPPGHGFGI